LQVVRASRHEQKRKAKQPFRHGVSPRFVWRYWSGKSLSMT